MLSFYCEYFACLISRDSRGNRYEFNSEGGDIAAAWLHATGQTDLVMSYYHYYGY